MNDPSPASGAPSVRDLIARLGSNDDAIRGPAWQEAWTAGPGAVTELVALMETPDRETARAAKRALWNLVDHSGHPSAATERRTVVNTLIGLLQTGKTPAPTARELIWMLSTVGGGEAVAAIAACLNLEALREDARCALQRFPGPEATTALRSALDQANGDFACALADALRARGESILEYPSQRLVPSKTTSVGKPV